MEALKLLFGAAVFSLSMYVLILMFLVIMEVPR